jgi:hypothetical protein
MDRTVLIFSGFLAVLTTVCFFSVPSVMADGARCYNPTIYNEHGVPLLPTGGWAVVNGTEYSSLLINHSISIKNTNIENMVVTFKPYGGLRDYVDDAQIVLAPGQTSPINLSVWVGGQSYQGTIFVYYSCESVTSVINSFVNILIIGQHIEAPPASNCSSLELDGCYSGMKRDYYCSNHQLLYRESCSDSCCKSFGGAQSMCSDDKTVCFTYNNLPPGENGNIAFLCRDNKCNDAKEKDYIFLLRFSGWNVTGLPLANWTQPMLEKHDMIVCADERAACKFAFNSLIYNMHTDRRMPFLEVPYTGYATAGLTFDYVLSNRALFGRKYVFINPFSSDSITQGLTGNVTFVKNADRFTTFKSTYLSLDIRDLVDVDKLGQVSMFTVKESIDHGRYAFIGWLYDSSYLTSDGRTVLNRTLTWLKHGDEFFGGTNDETPRKGSVALICKKDDCSQKFEIGAIKKLRAMGYSVTGMAQNSWTTIAILNYDLIACADSSMCSLDPKTPNSSPFYIAHMYYGKPFLEMPYNGDTKAATIFGITTFNRTYRALNRAYGYGIVGTGIDPILNGNTEYMELSQSSMQMYGPNRNIMSTGTVIAVAPNSNVSASFVSESSETKGRYAYIGYASDYEKLGGKGLGLIDRTIQWLLCGNGCLPAFSTQFPDLDVHFDVTSPTNTTYKTGRIQLNITSDQKVKQMLYSVNGSRKNTACRDCSKVSRSLSLKIGPQFVNVTLVDYLGRQYEKFVYFTYMP